MVRSEVYMNKYVVSIEHRSLQLLALIAVKI